MFPAERGGYLDLHDFRNQTWKPAQVAGRKRSLTPNAPAAAKNDNGTMG